MGFKKERDKLLILLADLEGFGENSDAKALLTEVKNLLGEIKKSKRMSGQEKDEFQKNLTGKVEKLERDYTGIYDTIPYYEML